MRNMILVCCCAVLALGALNGCNKLAEQTSDEAAESIAEAAMGGNADVEIDGDQVKIATEDGGVQTIAAGSGEFPEGWPASLPQYPGSKITAGSKNSQGEHVAYAISLSTGDGPGLVMAYYKEKALAAGFTLQSTISDGGRFADHYTSPEWNFNIGCTSEGNTTSVTLMLGTSGEGISTEGGEPLSMHSGKLPAGFPVDVVQVYPGAEIDNAASRGQEHLLTMKTADAPEAVFKFYEGYLTGSGWNKAAAADSEGTSMRSFEGEPGEIVVNVQKRDDGAFITVIYNQK